MLLSLTMSVSPNVAAGDLLNEFSRNVAFGILLKFLDSIKFQVLSVNITDILYERLQAFVWASQADKTSRMKTV
jgi:hypothetical protein